MASSRVSWPLKILLTNSQGREHARIAIVYFPPDLLHNLEIVAPIQPHQTKQEVGLVVCNSCSVDCHFNMNFRISWLKAFSFDVLSSTLFFHRKNVLCCPPVKPLLLHFFMEKTSMFLWGKYSPQKNHTYFCWMIVTQVKLFFFLYEKLLFIVRYWVRKGLEFTI